MQLEMWQYYVVGGLVVILVVAIVLRSKQRGRQITVARRLTIDDGTA